MNNATCSGCGAPIKWIITPKGKKMPVDLAARRFYVISGGKPVLMQGHEPHWATCPKANRFHEKKNVKQIVQDLGTANGWNETPDIVKNCEHELKGHKISNCYYERRCDICGYVYRIDSSG